ncbi:hypothetical protein BRADI_1g65595v3 [Brachypodium distachyon]|uniref:Uncharacterized protein n=1 Tax=Brachypodium distachyon TaxID=15368 RepID=A0A2K2DTJ4_BRADI|nr:hypothetical protein BRADI_1g65595v3 [Brachypodium distachyon]
MAIYDLSPIFTDLLEFLDQGARRQRRLTVTVTVGPHVAVLVDMKDLGCRRQSLLQSKPCRPLHQDGVSSPWFWTMPMMLNPLGSAVTDTNSRRGLARGR